MLHRVALVKRVNSGIAGLVLCHLWHAVEVHLNVGGLALNMSMVSNGEYLKAYGSLKLMQSLYLFYC